MLSISLNRANNLPCRLLHKLSSCLQQLPQGRHSSNVQTVRRIGQLDLEEICRTGAVPEKFNFAKDVFDWHVLQRPNDPALWFCNEKNEDRIWSFAELRSESVKAALAIQHVLQGPPSERRPFVLTVLPRIPEWWFLHMGAIRNGTIFCPGTTMLTSEDIQYRLEASSAHVILTDEENAEKVDKAHQQLLKSPFVQDHTKRLKKMIITDNGSSQNGDWVDYHQMVKKFVDQEINEFRHADTKSEDIAQVFFTSGTTGKPKMVAHVHCSYGIGHVETARQLQLQPKDVMWNISDPGWAKSSYSNFFAPWIAGSTVFIHQMKPFEAKSVLNVLRSKPVSVLCAPPTLYRTMIPEPKEAFEFEALRMAFGAGEAVNAEVMRAWKEKTDNISLGEMYGQTEFTALGCEAPDDSKKGSLGKPNGMYKVKIVDETGKQVSTGEEGILALSVKPRHPVGLFRGYLKPGKNGPTWDDEKNSQCFVGDMYLTFDKCLVDADDYIYFVGRADDIINSAGYRIGPNEVESALQTHPAVVESAAVPSPDDKRGEVVKAFIVLHEKYKAADKTDLIKNIQNHVKEQTAPYKYPRKIEFVECLPKTVSGKILRRELKKQEYAKVHN